MKVSSYQIRQCDNPDCGLRYPLIDDHPFGERCPSCFGLTHNVFSGTTSTIEPEQSIGSSYHFEAMLDNIRSSWNVGSMFRTAEGFGLRQLHLCGITPTPETAKLGKTALGAESIVPWIYHPNSIKAAESLVNKGYLVLGLEYNSNAESIYSLDINRVDGFGARKIILIAGNEEIGVDPGLLELCHRTIYIPMRGIKQSFNVAVAFGIAVGFISKTLTSETE
jgi:23S rRNA (guanosine2251-2'-O)-methyltransferase